MNREILRQKLHDRLNHKKQSRMTPKNKEINKMKEEHNELLKDKRITIRMLELYSSALLKYPNNNIPKPNEILDDIDKYKKVYSNYILEIINESKKYNLGINATKLLFDNEYTNYLTHILNIPKMPNFLK
jgi:hypothetical protein